MLKLWENPMLSIDDRLEAASGEIERLHGLLESAAEREATSNAEETKEAAGHRLALELECLLLDTKDLPTVSKWWDSGIQALEEWQRLFPYNGPRLGD